MRPFSFAFSFPAAFLSYAHPRASRSSSRLPSRRASRLMRSVVSCRPSCRLIGSARFACRLVWAPFRSAVRSFSFCLSGRFCLAFSCRLVLVSLLRLVSRLVGSSCSLPSSRFCLTRGRLGSVLVPGSRVRAVLSCCSLVSVRPVRHRFMSSVVGRGCASWSWGGRGLLFSSHPSHHHACSLLTHSLRDGSMGGCGIWGAVPCCSPLVPCPLMPHRSPHHVGSPSSSLRSLIPSSTKQESRGRKRRRRGNRTGTMKTRRIETRRLTRWIKRDARQDEDGTETIRRTSKQRDARRDGGTRRGNETASNENGRTTTNGNGAVPLLLASTQHAQDETERDEREYIFTSRPTPSPQALSHPPASISPPPPGVG